ncbi:MAG: sulfatase-like hydrolase/transferase [Spirochaetales bacterium]|nr:sulfatase-like hydrolase/transferase [Spirochaetales bacterium]
MNKPNILWYCTDQQRFDTIRSLGNEHIRTPNLDRLVERGVAFTNAYSQAPICTPSRASFLTGQYPATTHVHRNGNDYFFAHGKLVTRIFADHGYDCGLVGKLHLARSEGQLERRTDDGYRFYQWSHHPQPDWPQGHAYADWLQKEKKVDPDELYAPLRGVPYGPGVPAEYHQTTWCTETAMRFISQKREGPWLLSVNPFDPHPPFDPPQEYLDRYNHEELPYPLFREEDVQRQRAFAKVDQQTMEAVDPYEAEKHAPPAWGVKSEKYAGSEPPRYYNPRKVKACYYASIELIDHEFGRLIDFLETTGELENTIVIFASDHGELLGDHGLIYKGCRFFESLVHVPLIISWAGGIRAGMKSNALVELIDLAPTLLEAAGLETPYTMQGKSLLSLLTGGSDPDTHKPYVISEYNDALRQPNGTHGSMYFDGRYKSILYHDVRVGELYDLETDPGEFENLWNDRDFASLKCELLTRHFNAMMLSSGAGVSRSASY